MEPRNPRTLTAALVFFTLFFRSSFAAKSEVYSARLVHRFSAEEARGFGRRNGTNTASSWPEKKSFERMRLLMGSDAKRQRRKLLGAENQVFVGSDEGRTFNFGNDMGWLHYAWIDIGTPSNSYLVALDSGSDMLWVPCECTQCAPLTLSHSSNMDKELKEYNPSQSSSSKQVPCSHDLCEMGGPNCKYTQGRCPYSISYSSQGTSSSGFLYEDQLHLMPAGGNGPKSPLRASIMIGCGSKQTGEYLDGIAPDGVLGLGPGNVSVPSFLAKSGLIVRSFSFCYDKNHSGQLYFGDEGPSSQKSTPFLPLEEEDQSVYLVEVEAWCVESSCLNKTGHKAQVDTGTSFTYLPKESYQQVVSEFQRQLNAQKISVENFEYCYAPRSLRTSNIPHVKLVFSKNQTLLIQETMFHIPGDEGGLYCLGIQSIDGDLGIIGQNVLMGYRVVFDWEKLRLGWSVSSCHDVTDKGPSGPLPTEDQAGHHKPGAAPAVAVLAPPKSSASAELSCHYLCKIGFLLLLWIAFVMELIR